MSDLSGLNPTPHAIAVYASSPLSPVATQHSLPSGRYSLLGPDFHRLDRTSLRLAHSFNHLVGAGEQRRWHFEAYRLGCLQVDDKLELDWSLDGEVGGLGTFQDFVNIDSGAADHFDVARRIRHESAGIDILPVRVHRRQPVHCRKLHNRHAVSL